MAEQERVRLYSQRNPRPESPAKSWWQRLIGNAETDNYQLVSSGLTVNYGYSRQRATDYGGYSSKLYGGARDIYAICGYPTSLTIGDYLGRYQRQGLAKRVVRAEPVATWRKLPTIRDGASDVDSRDDTPFCQEWGRLAGFGDLDRDLLSDSRSYWYYLLEADILAGIGGFAILLFGFSEGRLDEPLRKGGRNKLLYLSVYHAGQVEIRPESIDTNTSSERYGLPEYYDVLIDDVGGYRKVHYSRVLHVCETDDLYGTSRLTDVYNHLIEVEKILAAAAEAGWRAADRKWVNSTKDGYRLANKEEAIQLAQAVEDMNNNQRNVIVFDGMDTQVISGQIVDPSASANAYLTQISIAKEIPHRILTGSERGELASTQDDDTWLDKISGRRISIAESIILRPFIYRLIYAGVLPMPSSKSLWIEWPSLYESSDGERATTFKAQADAIAVLSRPGIERLVNTEALIKWGVRGVPDDAVLSTAETDALDAELDEEEADATQTQILSDALAGRLAGMPKNGQGGLNGTEKQPVN